MVLNAYKTKNTLQLLDNRLRLQFTVFCLCLLDLLTRGSCDKCDKELTRYHKFWKCESQHMICYYCHADQTFDDVTNRRCLYADCGKDLEPVKPDKLMSTDERVFIYVDDSNMWIEAKKLAAIKSKLKCVQDPRLRLDIGKVTDVVAMGRDVAWGTLYGSEPPPIDTVWQKIRDRGWKVITSKRNRFTKKEKQVDHQMVADITALVSDRSVAKGKVVMVSGDADMIPAVKECLKMKWSIEIWMWESGISSSLIKMAEQNPNLMNISKLDSKLEAVTFTNFKFGEKEIPKSHSVIIKNFDFSPDEEWQKNLSEKLGWPFQFCLIGPEGLDNPVDYEDIILIFANVKSVDGKEFGNIFDEIFENLKQEYPGKIVNFPAYRKKFDQKADICIANKYEALQIVDEQLLSVNKTSNQATSHMHAGELQGSDEDKAEFEVVQKKPRRKNQQYSVPCESRSNCKNRLKCKYHHTDNEQKFFRNPKKDRECLHKGCCKYGPARCHYAHSNKDSFCCKCHQWGHLQEKCTLK